MLSAILLQLLITASARAQWTPMPQEFADQYGAKCLDGSPPSYSLLKQDPHRWILFIEGGGWCFAPSTCEEMANSPLGSSRHFAAAPPAAPWNGIGGLLSPDPRENPRFFNFTFLFLHYCDGSSHTSNATAIRNGRWHRGRPNLEAQIQYQIATAGLASAQEVILSGGSAGGFSAYLGLDFVRTLLPPAVRLVGAPDAGFFIDIPNAANTSNVFRNDFVGMDPIWNSTGSGSLNALCLSAFPSDQKWRCFFPENAAPYIHTPWHSMMSAYDLAASSIILQLGCIGVKCSPQQMAQQQAYRETFLAMLAPAVASFPGTGAYVDSCLVHEQNVDYCNTQPVPNCRGWNKYNISVPGFPPAQTPQQGFTLWYDALMGRWDEVVAERAAWGLEVAASAHLGPSAHPARAKPQAGIFMVDPLLWPDNLSCKWNGTGPPN